jgi:hypothetical protein
MKLLAAYIVVFGIWAGALVALAYFEHEFLAFCLLFCAPELTYERRRSS